MEMRRSAQAIFSINFTFVLIFSLLLFIFEGIAKSNPYE